MTRTLGPELTCVYSMARLVADCPWMRHAWGEADAGVRETPGHSVDGVHGRPIPGSPGLATTRTPRIGEYLETVGLGFMDDETAWCSAFAHWCMRQADVDGPSGSKEHTPAAARSWLDWGLPMEEPRYGAVVVFRRGSNPKSGHVAFFVRTEGRGPTARHYVLGGNQGNAVNVRAYPASRVVGYRWPHAAPGSPGHESIQQLEPAPMVIEASPG